MTQTILYVDDEHAVLRAMAHDLRPWLTQRELNLETVDSGEKCLNLLESTEDDVVLVISDLRMPGMKGSELIESISHRYPDVGLVLLTAYSDMADITRAVSSDIYGLITKPWDVGRLTAELDRMVTRVRNERRRARREYELESQLRIAGDFQYRYFTHQPPSTQRFDIETSNRPAPGIYVTGDYYEVIRLTDTRMLCLLGDAVGHGVKSAFIATTVKAIIDDSMDLIHSSAFDLGSFMNTLNTQIINRLSGASEVLISFSAALIDADSGTLHYAGGGNPPLCIIRGGQLRMIPTDAPALGCSLDEAFAVTEIALEPGDRMVLCTDGVFDRGSSGRISWNVLTRIFERAHGASPFIPQVERILGAMDVLETSGDDTRHRDDLTILSVLLRAADG